MSLAPIVLFTYNRLEATKKTIQALQENFLAVESKLIIFSDGAKNENTESKVTEVRNYLKSINGFASIEIIESINNKGLANSIITGVTEVINQYGKVIVLEDDLVTLPNFLNYMNQNLDFYQENEKIISICGYGLKIRKPKDYNSDVYLYGRSSSWGWATWKNRWTPIDWEVKDWNNFKTNKIAIRAFNKNGSDMFAMLKSVTEGNGNSWAIRFCYEQFKKSTYSIMPFKTLVNNIGFSESGTNTKFKFSRFKTRNENPNKLDFLLDKDIVLNDEIQKECYKYHSLMIRIYSRIRYILNI